MSRLRMVGSRLLGFFRQRSQPRACFFSAWECWPATSRRGAPRGSIPSLPFATNSFSFGLRLLVSSFCSRAKIAAE